MSNKPYMRIGSRVPHRICKKARGLLTAFNRGELRPRVSHRKHYLIINVTGHFRLLSKTGGNSWKLMNHKEYESEIDL